MFMVGGPWIFTVALLVNIIMKCDHSPIIFFFITLDNSFLCFVSVQCDAHNESKQHNEEFYPFKWAEWPDIRMKIPVILIEDSTL